MPNDTSMPESQPAQPSRYQLVQQILDNAAGNSSANYQGLGRFWNLPLPQFLSAVVCNVRMIAPGAPETVPAPSPSGDASPPAGSPCCNAQAAPPIVHGNSSRSARSGLIVGLKGAWPFDGTQFPRLPWGGAAVQRSDIDFICRWIDDGCPELDGADAGAAEHLELLAAGDAPHILSVADANVALSQAGKLQLRQNIEYLSDTELADFRHAIGELMNLNQWPQDMRNYNSRAQLHGDECPHGWSIFLPWHRIYLRNFEHALQDIVPSVTLPYWDWTESSSQQVADHYIPKAFRCAVTHELLSDLSGKVSNDTISKLNPLEGQDFSSFNFLNQCAGGLDEADQTTLIAALKAVNPLFTEARYPGEFKNSLQVDFQHHYPTPDDIDRIRNIGTWREFGGGLEVDQSFGVLDKEPHNTMHIWIGGAPAFPPGGQGALPPQGDMLNNLTAAYDPIFWAHHSNIDRIWAQWQELHPGVDPPDPTDVLPGVNSTVADSLSTRKLGYEYASDTYIFPTDPTLNIKKFISGNAGVLPGVMAAHRRAELRLDSVHQPQESFIVRVFLNLPEADVNTSIDNNPHYAGHFALFGHGKCIGGPGHCDPRPLPRRVFDTRPPHHNDPWNLRMDITSTVRQLRDSGEKDLQVSLIILPVQPDSPAARLRMRSVSLTFHD